MTSAEATAKAFELELLRLMQHEPGEPAQGPGTSHFRSIELEMQEARRQAGLPTLTHTYAGLAYRFETIPYRFERFTDTRWNAEPITGAFGIRQRLGNGRACTAVVLDNGVGDAWLATDLAALTPVGP